MRPTVLSHLVVLFACLAGCHLPHRDGPISKSLVTSRQLSRQGLKAMERGRWDQAESLLAKAVRECPDDPEAHRHYAEALWEKGSRAPALEHLNKAARLSYENAGLQVQMAEMHLAMGQLAEAEQAIDRALKIDPHLQRAWLVRGRILRAEGRLADAQAALHRSLHYAPEDPDTLFDLAEIYREADEPERALAVLQSLSGTYSPGEEPQQVLYLTGLAYSALGRYEEAAEKLAAAASSSPPGAELLCRLAENALLSGHPAEAERAVRQALAVDPAHAASRDLLAQIFLAQQPPSVPRR